MGNRFHAPGCLACLVLGKGQSIFEFGELLRIDQYGRGLAVVGDRDALPRVRGLRTREQKRARASVIGSVSLR